MPIVGAVLDLFPGAAVPPEVSSDPRIELGRRIGDRVPIVVVTATLDEDRGLLEQVRSLPGVVDLLVAFADVSDLPTPNQSSHTDTDPSTMPIEDDGRPSEVNP